MELEELIAKLNTLEIATPKTFKPNKAEIEVFAALLVKLETQKAAAAPQELKMVKVGPAHQDLV